MKIECNKCFYVIDRDKYAGDVIVEEYKNVFGTYCPNCNNFIDSGNKRGICELQEENKFKKEIMIQEILNRIRKKLRGDL